MLNKKTLAGRKESTIDKLAQGQNVKANVEQGSTKDRHAKIIFRGEENEKKKRGGGTATTRKEGGGEGEDDGNNEEEEEEQEKEEEKRTTTTR